MSKKEIRRAARDAYPALKGGASTKRGGTGGAYSKRQVAVGRRGKKQGGGAATRSGVRPPSWRRAIISGVVVALLYFVLIQWIMPRFFVSFKSSVLQNVYITVIAACFFPVAGYWSDRFRYRRYLRKHGGSDK